MLRATIVSVSAVVALLSPAASLATQPIKITLLGTGGPPPSVTRQGPSTLVEAGGQVFLIDAGRGAFQRLTQAGIRWQQVDGILFTHLHSDHVVGFPDLWLSGWLVAAGRMRPLRVWGPTGTKDFVGHLREAFAFDIAIRKSDDRAAPSGVELVPLEVSDGIVHDSGGVRITAFRVDHAPVEPALGYRIDFSGRSVVLSGDTRVSDNLMRHAMGADVLIHEVVSPESFVRAGVVPDRIRSVVAHHVTPDEAGRVFARTRPRLAVYSHIVQPTATPDDLIPGTRREYSGRLEVGVDLMVIIVGDSIEVRRPTM